MRHPSLHILLSLALAAPGCLLAAPPSPAQAPKAEQNPPPAAKAAPAPADQDEKNPYIERFKQLDANGDGYVSLSEWPLDEAKFRVVDRNEDGRLSRIELLTPNVLHRDPRFQPMRGLYIYRYGPMEPRPRGVGGYTRLETRTGFEDLWNPLATPQDQLRFQNLDRNRDDRLSRAEWPGARDVFDRIDRNRDGVLSPGEWP